MDWVKIPEFSNYSINQRGEVRNDDLGHLMRITQNQAGVAMVGLTRDKIQYRRGVAHLVAEMFLDPHPYETFTTPINLDGDRMNCRLENLMWRPRWFAVKYHKQFEIKRPRQTPVVDIKTGEEFPDTREAAVKYGLLDKEIFLAAKAKTYVFPTFQEFRLIEA
jgi:hypothetical protein